MVTQRILQKFRLLALPIEKAHSNPLFANSPYVEVCIMRKGLLVTLLALIPSALVSTVASAEGCGDYPLTPAQAYYLSAEVPDVTIPEGDVPVVRRCDVDGNNVIDNSDLFAIRAHRGQPAAHPDDPMDWDGNGVIHGRDVGGCASSCTSNGCSVKDGGAEEEGLQAGLESDQADLPSSPGGCFQVGDFDNDGAEDFMGIYEYTGSATRSYNWELQLVILTEDSQGNVQHVTFPYTGQVAEGSDDMLQHLSMQPAGVVDLNPGSFTISEPGVVSYRNGEPKTIYYFYNGTLTRGFYGVDD